MSERKYPLCEVSRRGREIYDEKLKAVLEPEHIGKFLIIDIETGDYEMDDDEFAASKRAHAKHPDGAFYGMRVGFRVSVRMGFRYTYGRPVKCDDVENEVQVSVREIRRSAG